MKQLFVFCLLALLAVPLTAQDINYYQSWSPSGNEMTYSKQDAEGKALFIMDLEKGTSKKISTDLGFNCCSHWNPDGSVVLYNTVSNGYLDVVAYEVASGITTNYTDNAIHDGGAVWSHSGHKFAHTSVRDDNSGAGIFLTNKDGSGRRVLTDLAKRRAYNVRWSPDDTHLVYLGTENGNNEVFKIRADGTGETRLTYNSATEYAASWSPKNDRIFFRSTRDGDWDLYSIDLDGDSLVNVTNDEGDVENYSFSKDGEWITYDSDVSGEYNVYLMKSDGTRKKRLTYLGMPAKYATFTPDDSQLVLHYYPAPDTIHIALIEIETQRIRSLTANHFEEKQFPENLRIAFTSYRDGNADIYMIRPDGTELEKITDSDDDNSYAEWLDNGRTLRFYRSQNRENFKKYVRDMATGRESLYEDQPMEAGDMDRSFNRDSSLVAFRKMVNDTLELFVGDPTGSTFKQITDNAHHREPALLINTTWSNDGKKLAFLSGIDYYNLFLKIYDTETDRTSIITNRGYMNSGMKWSKDDTQIFLNASTRETNYELYRVDLESRAMTQFTFDPTSGNVHFDISPDGSYLVFESQRDSIVEEKFWNSEIYIVRTDGTLPVRLTNHPEFDGRPIWFPLHQ